MNHNCRIVIVMIVVIHVLKVERFIRLIEVYFIREIIESSLYVIILSFVLICTCLC